MSTTTFSFAVGEWCRGVMGAAEAIFKMSVQDVVGEMQKVGPSKASTKAAIKSAKKKFVGPPAPAGAGGRLPVDTGFLRASLLASTSSMPAISPGAVPVEGKRYTVGEQVELTIAGLTLGQPFYAGYTAAYAAAMEYGSGSLAPYAFVRTAAQGWQQIVSKREAELMRRLGLS